MTTSPARHGVRCRRWNIAWMFAGGMRWKAFVCSSVVIQSSEPSLFSWAWSSSTS
jgi:hypothetical protein